MPWKYLNFNHQTTHTFTNTCLANCDIQRKRANVGFTNITVTEACLMSVLLPTPSEFGNFHHNGSVLQWPFHGWQISIRNLIAIGSLCWHRTLLRFLLLFYSYLEETWAYNLHHPSKCDNLLRSSHQTLCKSHTMAAAKETLHALPKPFFLFKHRAQILSAYSAQSDSEHKEDLGQQPQSLNYYGGQ